MDMEVATGPGELQAALKLCGLGEPAALLRGIPGEPEGLVLRETGLVELFYWDEPLSGQKPIELGGREVFRQNTSGESGSFLG